jgi:zeaxanthin glucosyltransferase
MKRVLVVTLPERGHYHPLLGPALELERRGAEVAFATSADIRDELRAAGITNVLIPPGTGKPSDALRGEKLARVLSDSTALRGWIRELLVELPARQVEPIRAIVRDYRPDVVAIDTMSYEGAIAAALERVPWVGWSTSLNPVVPDSLDSELIHTIRVLDADRRRLFASYGLTPRFRVSDVLAPSGTACFTTEALVGHADAGTELVGPSLGGRREGGPIDLSFTEDRPLVYVSFGSQAWHQPKRFDLLLEAAHALDIAILASMGDLADEYTRRGLPARVRCLRFVAQLDALRHACVAVTHGGANSVMEGLANGVPLLVAPICNDQPHNRDFVERAGAGIGIDLDRCSLPELISVMKRLLADGAERSAARRIADSYRTRSGDRGAADLAWRNLR